MRRLAVLLAPALLLFADCAKAYFVTHHFVTIDIPIVVIGELGLLAASCYYQLSA